MSEKNDKGSFWTTIPGCLTGIAAVITAIAGMIAVLYQIGFLGPKTSSPTNSSVPPKASQPTSLPTVSRQGRFRVEFTGSFTNYDFDSGQALSDYQSPAIDFFFKPDNNNDTQSLIGVYPAHNAKFGGGFLDVLPWEVPQNQLTTSSGSVPQNRQIPCVTSMGVYCSFSLSIGNNGLNIDYTVYSR